MADGDLDIFCPIDSTALLSRRGLSFINASIEVRERLDTHVHLDLPQAGVLATCVNGHQWRITGGLLLTREGP